MELLKYILDGSFMPHGHCLLWRSDLLFLHVTGDILTAFSYLVIPLALITLVKRRNDLSFDWIFQLFAGFILFCGITHLISLVNVWHGFYFIEGMAKFVTGLISVTTAIMIWRLMPVALSVPSRLDLVTKNQALAEAQLELEITNAKLEERVAQRTSELQKLAITDPLTGLLNRRELITRLENEIERSQRYDSPLSILLLDLDFFKSINDHHGHITGDRVLIDAAQTFGNLCRLSDQIGRYGGEEFLLVLPNTSQADAATLAERIRLQITKNHIATINGQSITYSGSIGVCEYQPGVLLEDFINQADTALYQAKLNGRNRVVTADLTA